MRLERPDIPDQRAIALANETHAHLVRRGVTMSQQFQLSLWHWIRNGRATCPDIGCACAKEEADDQSLA